MCNLEKNTMCKTDVSATSSHAQWCT